MQKYKEYTANNLKGKRVRFKCDCIVGLDITGMVVDYELNSNEIIYIIKEQNTGKLIRVGENTPKLYIDILK